jgi:hypothetical protein
MLKQIFSMFRCFPVERDQSLKDGREVAVWVYPESFRYPQIVVVEQCTRRDSNTNLLIRSFVVRMNRCDAASGFEPNMVSARH